MLNEAIKEKISELEEIILQAQPESKFRLEPSEQENIWDFCIYTPEGNLQMPPAIMQQLDAVWREHKITVLAIVYPLSLYEEDA
ncbi:MAG: hypothetical protein EXR50_00935 [Dehalococcoidia bacterium]|nr:hypothetical protein [Dehalococcoidia bacterium]